ncbi:inositol monophosphatase 1-like [Culicoides brevitarsis]|uniref:inositol monophosphatase 1-like n=1 Tax=Culicoides brevitarsis TaxID=469753 RepID=UPI00307C6B22
MNSTELDECFDFVKALVLKCGAIVKAGQQNIGKVDAKTIFSDIVTKYDKEVENVLINGIKEKYPEHCFIGEESSSEDDKIPALTSKPTWIIDPIDGTINFVKNNQYFCISVGLVVNKETVLGIIYAPVTDDFYAARAGMGATLNGNKISVNCVKDMQKALLGQEVSLAGLESRRLKTIERTRAFVTHALGIRCFGSAALTLCYVAKGLIDGFNVEDLYPWDICAGALIVQEAGGMVINANGGKYDIMKPDVITACTPELCEQMLKIVRDSDEIIEKLKQ